MTLLVLRQAEDSAPSISNSRACVYRETTFNTWQCGWAQLLLLSEGHTCFIIKKKKKEKDSIWVLFLNGQPIFKVASVVNAYWNKKYPKRAFPLLSTSPLFPSSVPDTSPFLPHCIATSYLLLIAEKLKINMLLMHFPLSIKSSYQVGRVTEQQIAHYFVEVVGCAILK